MGHNNHQEIAASEIEQLGLKPVWPPVRCKPCRALVKQVVKRYREPVCYHCHITKRKALASLVVAGMLVLCGCQSPRQAKFEAQIAGQFVKCELRR